MRSRKFEAREKLAILEQWWEMGEGKRNARKVARDNWCSVSSLYKWNKKYDGSIFSLENGDQSPHYVWNKYSQDELDVIINASNQIKNGSNLKLYYVLRTQYAFIGSIRKVYRMLKRLQISKPCVEVEKYVTKEYRTPNMIGVKWQIDVKYVPYSCLLNLPGSVSNSGRRDGLKLYQFTCIDEASRKRFMFIYDSKGAAEARDFYLRCIAYFGYAPLIVQTDNGKEFTNYDRDTQKRVDAIDRQLGKAMSREHAFTEMMRKYGTRHDLIQIATPRHNGKVERSHRTDNEEFYAHTTFESIQDARAQIQCWVDEYNNGRYNSAIGYKTPQQREDELIEKLKREHDEATFEDFDRSKKLIYKRVAKIELRERKIAWAQAERDVCRDINTLSKVESKHLPF